MVVGSRPNRIHATHLAKMDRIRKEFWSSYRPRQEITAYREQIVADQKRAEKGERAEAARGAHQHNAARPASQVPGRRALKDLGVFQRREF